MKESKIVIDVEGNESKEYYETQSKIPENEINILRIKTTLIEEIAFKEKFDLIWICPNCKNENLAKDTPINFTKWSSSATHGIIWEQPIRTLANRAQFDSLNMKRVTVFLQEIEMGLMAYQQAYFDYHHSDMKEAILPFTHDANSNDEVSN